MLLTQDSKAEVGGKLTVDIEAMAELDLALMEAYLSNSVKYQWYRNEAAITGAVGVSLDITDELGGAELSVTVSYGSAILKSDACPYPLC